MQFEAVIFCLIYISSLYPMEPVAKRNSNIMDLHHKAWYANQHHKNVKKFKRRQDMSTNFKVVNPLFVFSAVLGFQTAKLYLSMFIT